MSRLSVIADPSQPTGHALITVRDAAGVPQPVEFGIQRPDWSDANLGPNGWQVAAALLRPVAVSTVGNDLVLVAGPAVCNHIESGGYMVAIPALQVEEGVYWPDIVPAHGGSSAYFQGAATPAATPLVKPLPPKPGPVHPPISPRPAQDTQTSDTVATIAPPPARAWWLAPGVIAAMVVVVLVLAGGGAYHAWRSTPTPVPTPTPTTQQPTVPTPPAANLDTMPVPDLVSRNKPDEMTEQARKRMATQPGQALLLLEAAGDDRRYGPALVTLARLFDPNKPRQGGIPADLRQSARYYRDAEANGEHDGAADREALHATAQQKANAGDMSARTIAQDYWP